MIDLTDDLILSKIQPQNAYYDRNSKEKSTNIIKPKYKLAGNILLEIYTFFILTTTKDACQKFLTLEINQDDWDERVSGYLEGCGYLDIRKIEILNKDEILQKCKDKKNRFLCVAKLCDKKYKQLKKLRYKIQSSNNPPQKDTTNLIFQALREIKPVDEIYKKLELP